MSLRLLEFVVRDDESDGISSLLADQEVHQVWITSTDDSTRGFRVLLEAESVEPVTDALTERLGSREECRMVLLPVEATVPRIEETKPPENESADAGSGNGSASPALRISREELYEDLASSTQLTPSYAVMVTLSTVVAAVGLVRDDVAIIIGAMVIAPLLGPNITLSFASTLGDTKLARSALKTLAAGFGVAAAVSFLLGVVLEVDPSATEIASRTGAGIGNIALALAAGAAGSLAFTTGVPAVLVGVMVAVALLPPTRNRRPARGLGRVAARARRTPAPGHQHRSREPRGHGHVPRPADSASYLVGGRPRQEGGALHRTRVGDRVGRARHRDRHGAGRAGLETGRPTPTRACAPPART